MSRSTIIVSGIAAVAVVASAVLIKKVVTTVIFNKKEKEEIEKQGQEVDEMMRDMLNSL